ncbi:phage regulatory protein/antirepressor Ant [Bacillus velezensis]|uniref:phage regulatory protein/antirepressor Ant n=1 Tax=Bacillus velezensis TaxID=492670 RepID=UPI00100B4AF1|nr:phage regulatory protein/antirepressor Ant [Bacillus velezensis]MDQ9147369.1 phage regulatory protein/antirepressor Ant [Bacillus velezensis]MEC2185111.1 phage regulatory protein/antirepressor Ant [Bacillus velezensis]MED1775010.1 phage regulatory protein/antirepressor Ant [Bacillus velezensis]MED3451312.1 phage regulatory protein/antirepressor Ant [Bacillus velezensis]RXK25509.1 phage regulatory protein [Bacillus velezensis]
MNQLVFIEGDQVVTDSLTVAEVFGKRHDHVLRDIKNLDSSKEFNLHNFGEVEYKDNRNRTYKKYLIKRDGLAFLVFGYTGAKAALFKEKYISEFNRMENELQKLKQPSYMIDDPVSRAKRWITEQEERQQLEQTLRIQEPLVSFAESCMASEKSLLVREVAKLASKQGIVIGERQLFQKLRDWKMIFSNKNEPYQEYVNRGYFEVAQGVREVSGKSKTWLTMKITPKGQAYIINKLKKQLAS